MATVAAISTPPAVGGISLIRISGERAIEIAAKVFHPFGSTDVTKMKGHTCVYGKIVYGGEVLDDGLLTVFLAPRSYTGEDVGRTHIRSCSGSSPPCVTHATSGAKPST